MTYHIRRSDERKFFDHGWLKTYHTFSFGDYYDPRFMGFRDLRVINEDRIDPGQGFPPHQHRDMEIVSIVLEGSLAHRDSMGNESIIHANHIQAMSAGSGVTHSEYNPSTDRVHFLQIWIVPDTNEILPRYQEINLPSIPNQWVLIASREGREKSLKIQQDVELSMISLEAHEQAEKKMAVTRYGWLQMIDGKIVMEGETLQAGDGVSFENHSLLSIKAITPSRVLFFDLK